MARTKKLPSPSGLRKRRTVAQGDTLRSQMIRVDVSFASALREAARLATAQQGRTVGVTELTRKLNPDAAEMVRLFGREG